MDEVVLPDLPPTNSKYWEHADVYNRELKREECKHEFIYEDSNAKCSKCGIGLYLDERDTIVGGHLYRDNILVL